MNEEQYYENLARIFNEAQQEVSPEPECVWEKLPKKCKDYWIDSMKIFIRKSMKINEEVANEVAMKKVEYKLEFSKTREKCNFCQKVTSMIIRKKSSGKWCRVCDLHMAAGIPYLEKQIDKDQNLIKN